MKYPFKEGLYYLEDRRWYSVLKLKQALRPRPVRPHQLFTEKWNFALIFFICPESHVELLELFSFFLFLQLPNETVTVGLTGISLH